ncbi:MAG: hypothetical protein ACRDFQ_07450, partial [Anaerolineales bacterium]
GEISPDEAARLLSQKTSRAQSKQTAMGILDRVERGEISAAEAAERLEGRGAQADNYADANKVNTEIVKDIAFSHARTWGWWATPILLGIALVVGSGLLMNRDLADGQLGLAFLCAWAPLAFGVLLVVLEWAARKGPWLHFRANSHKPGRHVNLDMRLPVPLGVIRAFVQGFGINIAGFDEALDKLQESLAESRRRGETVYIRTTSDNGRDAMDIHVG